MLPPKRISQFLMAISLLIGICLHSSAQRTFINTPETIFEVTGSVNNCTVRQVASFCLPDNESSLFSLAFRNNFFYILSSKSNRLYKVSPDSPGNCTLLTSFPTLNPFMTFSTLNSMTIDRNGIIYAADAYNQNLYSYDPATNQQTLIGILPIAPAGDLLFYYDKLIYAAMGNTLMEVNIANPANSQPFMNTAPYDFFGIIAFPSECKKNKVYGISSNSQLVELDMENRRVVGVTCIFPWTAFDAASEVEDGNTVGVTIDSIDVFAACNSGNPVGSVNIGAQTSGGGILNYTVDQTLTNSTGQFGNLSMGMHQVRISNAQGCFKDSSFEIKSGLSPDIRIIQLDPESCQLQNGSITIFSQSNYNISYSLNNGPFQTSNTFHNLPAGVYHIKIRDEGHCEKDSLITLRYHNGASYIDELVLTPTYCNAKTGSVKVVPNSTGITASINNGPVVSNMVFENLDAGTYIISVYKDNACRIDTLVEIKTVRDPDPAVQINVTDQLCFDNNGTVSVNASGINPPYLYSIDNISFNNTQHFINLAVADYTIHIKNVNNCIWQFPITVKPYVKKASQHTLITKPASCEAPKSGEIHLTVTGEETPYSILFGQQVLPSITSIERLAAGKYNFAVMNKDGCVIDSIKAEVGMIITEACDKVMVTSAFTPNNDGLNDLFLPVYGSYVRAKLFTVYNRYGQMVFQSSSGQGWDGRFKGKLLHSDVYVWTFYYEDSRKEQQFTKGHVTLIR